MIEIHSPRNAPATSIVSASIGNQEGQKEVKEVKGGREMNEQPRNGSFGGFLAGLLIGAGMLLLMAPASGRDTRRRIAQTAGKVKSGARNKWDRVRGEVGRTAADLKTAVGAGRDAYARNREARGSTVRVHPL